MGLYEKAGTGAAIAALFVASGAALIAWGFGVNPDNEALIAWGAVLLGGALLVFLGLFVLFPALRFIGQKGAGLLDRNPDRQAPSGLTINSAVYHGLDVTDAMRAKVVRGLAAFICDGKELGVGDPAPGVRKKLVVTYTSEGQRYETTFVDGERVIVPQFFEAAFHALLRAQ